MALNYCPTCGHRNPEHYAGCARFATDQLDPSPCVFIPGDTGICVNPDHDHDASLDDVRGDAWLHAGPYDRCACGHVAIDHTGDGSTCRGLASPRTLARCTCVGWVGR